MRFSSILSFFEKGRGWSFYFRAISIFFFIFGKKCLIEKTIESELAKKFKGAYLEKSKKLAERKYKYIYLFKKRPVLKSQSRSRKLKSYHKKLDLLYQISCIWSWFLEIGLQKAGAKKVRRSSKRSAWSRSTTHFSRSRFLTFSANKDQGGDFKVGRFLSIKKIPSEP